MIRPSIKTIALESGVSKTTVSFVLNGRGDEKNISAETQKRVLNVAQRFNYQPNHLARSLSMGRSYTIGLIIPDISNPFFSKIARLVEYYAEQRGYSVMMASTDEKQDKEEKIIESFRNRLVDGVIIAPVTSELKHINTGMPMVNFDRIFTNQKTEFVTINDKETAEQLTQSLIDKGSNRIGLISLSSFLPNIKQRVLGYCDALEKNGIDVDEQLLFECDANTRSGVELAISQMINLKRPANGFLFLNNVLAADGIWVFNQYYPKLINKIQMASFDNLDVFDYAFPKVTSALQPGEAIAQKCVEMLCNQIEHQQLTEGVCLSTTIIER